MNKCHLCQQINNNVSKIYNNNIQYLAQTILKLKGFKVRYDLDNNKTLEVCENCKQGIESVSKLWKNIPDASSEDVISADTLEALHEHEGQPANLNHFVHGDCSTNIEPKLKPQKFQINLPNKRKTKDKPTSSTNFTSEPLKQRVRTCPKRFEDFDIISATKNKTSNRNCKTESNKSYATFLNNRPEVALLRLPNGLDIAKLVEVDNAETARKLRIICLICCQVFDFEKVYQTHLKEHDFYNVKEGDDVKNYLYYCKLCNKSFAHHYAVRRHSKFAHTEDRPLKCQYCEAHFKYKTNLDYHMAKHVPTKHFECAVCKKMFLKSYELKIHTRTHTKEKPYKCEFCSFAFAHSSNLKAHKKSKHSNNSIIVEKITPYERFMPPKELLEQNTDIQLVKDPLDLTCSPIFEDATSACKNDNIEESKKRKELKNHKDNNNLELAEVYEFRKENTNAAHKMGTFKLDSSILQMLPSATLLDFKKWPKSYQRVQQAEKYKSSKTTNSNSSEIGKNRENSMKNGYATRELLPQTFELEQDTNNSTDATKSIIKYTSPTQKTNYKSNASSHFVADFNSTTSNRNPTTFEVSYPDVLTKAGEFIDISKLPKSAVTKQDHEQNEMKCSKSSSDMSIENASRETNITESWKVIKVSARPIQINITNLVTPSTSNNIQKNSIEVVTGNSLTYFGTKSQQIETTTDCLVKNQESNIRRQSLLKPGLKRQQLPHLSLTNRSKNQTLLGAQPLITKIEVLPALNTLAMLQNESLSNPHTTLIKPPTEYKHQCTHCHKYFKQKSALTKHLRTHTGEKPYKCNLCAKSYADASNYKKHKILHKNAAEALNIAGTAAYAVQNSPAYSAVSDPDPDGIEIMQSIKKFQYSSTEEEGDNDDDDDGNDDDDDDDVEIDDASCTSSTIDSNMWQNALEQALNDDEIMENIRRNFAGINNAILNKNMLKPVPDRDLNLSFSTEDPD